NTQAVTFAQKNTALGNTPVISTNLTNAGDGQIVVGYLNPSSTGSALNSSSIATSQFNSVQVTLYRDANHGGAVPTFFGQLMGYNGANVTVKSTATAQPYSVGGFKANGSLNAEILPITLDMTTWLHMMPTDFTF